MIYNPHAPDWHKEAPPDITLAEYAAAWIDMAPHIGELAVYARGKKKIVEFGLRGAVSTWAMLDVMAEDGVLWGIDINPNAPLPDRVRNDLRFRFLEADATKIDTTTALDHADLVMIDAGH
jgi:predicted O-methyltransferase YrrM